MNMSIPPTEKRNDSEPKLTLQNTWCKMKLLILKYGVYFWTCTIMNTQKLDIYHIPWSDTLTKKCNGNWLPTHLETQVKVILPCSSECWSLSIVSLHAVNELPRQHWTKRKIQGLTGNIRSVLFSCENMSVHFGPTFQMYLSALTRQYSYAMLSIVDQQHCQSTQPCHRLFSWIC